MNRNFLKGVRHAIPITAGYLPIGLSFGVLASKILTPVEVLAMSVFVYAGSAQFLGISMIAAQASVPSILAAVFFINLRHFLFSAALAPYMKKIPGRLLALISAEITDESFAVAIKEAEGNQPPAPYYFGLQATAHSSWVVFTLVGSILGSLIPDPSKWGIDYALTAMFIALLLGHIRKKLHLFTAITAGALSVCLAMRFGGGWNIIIAAIIAATSGVVLEWQMKE